MWESGVGIVSTVAPRGCRLHVLYNNSSLRSRGLLNVRRFNALGHRVSVVPTYWGTVCHLSCPDILGHRVSLVLSRRIGAPCVVTGPVPTHWHTVFPLSQRIGAPCVTCPVPTYWGTVCNLSGPDVLGHRVSLVLSRRIGAPCVTFPAVLGHRVKLVPTHWGGTVCHLGAPCITCPVPRHWAPCFTCPVLTYWGTVCHLSRRTGAPCVTCPETLGTVCHCSWHASHICDFIAPSLF